MKEKKRPQSWHDKIQQKVSERELGLVSHPSFYFTPGVPTEDGWYVVKWGYTGTETYTLPDDPDISFYGCVSFFNGEIDYDKDSVSNFYSILSHAKLPEL